MRLYILVLVSFFTFSYGQTYCAGDQIILEHQNAEHVVGAGTEEYADGGTFKLADWNGDLNGGEYQIIFVDMSASW